MKKKLMAAAIALSLLFAGGCAASPAGSGGEAPPTASDLSSVQTSGGSWAQEQPGDVSAPPAPQPAGEQGTEEADAQEDGAPGASEADGSGDGEDDRTSNGPDDPPPENAAPTCTVSISCAAILENIDQLDAEKTDLVPADGVLLASTAVEFAEGESVFDVLKRVCRENKIHMEFSETPVYQSAYIEGIGNLYEFDCGEGSGWMYRVNGEFPNYGCSRYTLADGDTVEWVYTCDFGADVGGGLGA